MRVKRAIKKIAALGAGISMVGATILGAMAADLSDYPNMFVENGQFNGVIVVGDKAAAEDVVGAIDIATSLQYALGQPVAQPTQPGGQGGQISISGDAVSISEPNDMLELNERLGAVRETLTEFDLAGLQGGTIVTDEGSTDYNQYLRFEDDLVVGALEWIPSGEVTFQEDEDDIVGDYLKFRDGAVMFEYEVEFEEGAESTVDSCLGAVAGPPCVGQLDDFEDEELNMLGKVFSVVDTSIDTNVGGTEDVQLELLGGDVLDTLEEGETRTYTIDGKEYEVTLIIVSDSGSGNDRCKFSVNGEITDELEDGETDVLRDGTEIGLRDILPNEAEEETGGDIVEFFLGANKVELFDGNYSDDLFDTGGVEIHSEDIEDASVKIRGTRQSGGIKWELATIQYRLKADSPKGDIFIAPGHGVREYLDEPEGMLSDDWDIRYEGLMDTGVSIIRFDSSGDDNYDLQFTNREGLEYDTPFIDNSNDEGAGFKYGDDDDDLLFVEGNINGTMGVNVGAYTAGTVGVDTCGNLFPIDDGDYFVLTDQGGTTFPGGDETSFTHIVQYESIDVNNFEITLQDDATGQREVTFSNVGMPNSCVLGFANTLVVGGNTFDIYVSTGANGTGNATLQKYPLAVDLNSDGNVDFTQVDITVNGGGVLRLGGVDNAALLARNATGTGPAIPWAGTQWNATGLNTAASKIASAINYATFFRAWGSTAQGETYLTVLNGTATGNFTTTLTTLASEFDGNGVLDTGLNEELSILMYGMGSNNVDLDVFPNTQQYNDTQGLTVSGTGSMFDVINMESLDEEDLEQGLSTYGAFFEQTDEDSNNDAEDLTIEYPLSQRGADVFVTIGATQTTRVGAAAGGAVVINPITVGAAKLASEVAGQEMTQNIIAVGGSCINAVSAKWMGSDTPLCGAESGLAEGKAVVKLYEHGDNVGMLVAGWNAADTRRATKVVAEYQDYAAELVGMEVEVTGTSLSDITVAAPQP